MRWMISFSSRDLSSYVDIIQYHKRNPKKEYRNPFTIEQINTFWSLSEDMWYDVILILIYTSVRIGELLELKKEDIHLDEQWFQVTQSKTESGIRRVPIADSILPFFQKWYDYSETDTLLCTPDMEPFKYRNHYDSYWKPLIENLNLGYYTPTLHKTHMYFTPSRSKSRSNKYQKDCWSCRSDDIDRKSLYAPGYLCTDFCSQSDVCSF